MAELGNWGARTYQNVGVWLLTLGLLKIAAVTCVLMDQKKLLGKRAEDDEDFWGTSEFYSPV